MTPRQIKIITQIKSLLNELSKPERPSKSEAPRTGGPPPFGYSSQPRNGKERLPLVENELEQRILAHVARLREEGRTFEAIAETLNRWGYRTRSGGPWVFQSVQRLPFNNPKRKSAA